MKLMTMARKSAQPTLVSLSRVLLFIALVILLDFFTAMGLHLAWSQAEDEAQIGLIDALQRSAVVARCKAEGIDPKTILGREEPWK